MILISRTKAVGTVPAAFLRLSWANAAKGGGAILNKNFRIKQ
jgi:hypothetical protein